MNTKTVPRIRLKELSDWGYGTLQVMQDIMLRDAVSDGSGRWLPVPYGLTRGTVDFDTEWAGVMLRIEFTSDKVADLSWMAAKAYSYALYCGCMDQLRRAADYVGKTRFLGAGSTETAVATLGGIHISVSLTVIDPEEVEHDG